jgi:hypothetical protein
MAHPFVLLAMQGKEVVQVVNAAWVHKCLEQMRRVLVSTMLDTLTSSW